MANGLRGDGHMFSFTTSAMISHSFVSEKAQENSLLPKLNYIFFIFNFFAKSVLFLLSTFSLLSIFFLSIDNYCVCLLKIQMRRKLKTWKIKVRKKEKKKQNYWHASFFLRMLGWERRKMRRLLLLTSLFPICCRFQFQGTVFLFLFATGIATKCHKSLMVRSHLINVNKN